MKNKVLSIITSMTMVVMSLPDIGAMNYGDKGMSKSAIVKTVGGIAAGVAGAGLIAYGMMKGWNYYQELVANEVCKKIKNEQDNTGNGSIKLDADEFHKKIREYYYAVCADLRYGYLPSFVVTLGETSIIYLVKSKLKCCYNTKNYTYKKYTKLKSVKIPESVTSVGDSAFNGCRNLKSITILEDNECIRDYAYKNRKNLQSVIIPENVTSIGDSAFSCCTNLKSIEIPESVTSIGDGAFYSCENLESIKIPKSVTSIGNEVFRGCTNLKSIEIPENVTSIGECAFYSCENLKSTEIPKSVTSIGNGTFSYCTDLESIENSEGVTSIGDGAFCDCTKLKSVKIPKKCYKYR